MSRSDAVAVRANETSFRRSPLFRYAVAILCGMGIAASGVTLVRAADDTGLLDLIRFDQLRRLAKAATFRDPQEAPAHRARRAGPRVREAVARDGWGQTLPLPVLGESEDGRPVRRKARISLARAGEAAMSRRTMCVRLCDGYAFPIGPLASNADIPLHQQACEASCPGAQTALYTLAPGRGMDKAALARSVANGFPYSRLSTAFLFQKSRVAACSCQGPDNIAQRLPILMDPTLRVGDVVVDEKGRAKAFGGSPAVPHSPRAFADYRRSPALGKVARAQVDRALGTSQKEALARDFQKTMRVRQAELGRPDTTATIQTSTVGTSAITVLPEPAKAAGPRRAPAERYTGLREVTAPAGSASQIRTYAYAPQGGPVSASAPRIIEIR